jgi:hypothetical protein
MTQRIELVPDVTQEMHHTRHQLTYLLNKTHPSFPKSNYSSFPMIIIPIITIIPISKSVELPRQSPLSGDLCEQFLLCSDINITERGLLVELDSVPGS